MRLWIFCYLNMVLTMYGKTRWENRLITECKQECSDFIATNGRYLMYNTFNSSLTMSPFLHDWKQIKARNCLLRIRLGVSLLRSHRLRFARNAEADVACPFCNNEIESEIYFISSCLMYNDLRDKYILHKYVTCPSLFKLSSISNSDSLLFYTRLLMYAMLFCLDRCCTCEALCWPKVAWLCSSPQLTWAHDLFQ